jgi:hypothetical protein
VILFSIFSNEKFRDAIKSTWIKKFITINAEQRYMVSEKELLGYIEANRDGYIQFLKDMIQSKSYNPPGDEFNVALTIKEFLDSASLNCQIYQFGENRANLIVKLKDIEIPKTLLFNGHMDVVPPGDESEWKVSPLSAQIKRKKLMYGRGTTDMKGGLSAMICALKALKALKFESECSGNLILAAVADEETGGEYGTNKVVEEYLKNQKIDFLLDSVVDEFLGEIVNGFPRLTSIRVKNVKSGETKVLSADGVFYAIGHTPNTSIFKEFLELDEKGYIITKGKSTYTNIEGVFACGDVQDQIYRQAVSAAGSGCMAAIDAERWLQENL